MKREPDYIDWLYENYKARQAWKTIGKAVLVIVVIATLFILYSCGVF